MRMSSSLVGPSGDISHQWRDQREEPEPKDERMSPLLCQTMHVHSAPASPAPAGEAVGRNVSVVFSVV